MKNTGGLPATDNIDSAFLLPERADQSFTFGFLLLRLNCTSVNARDSVRRVQFRTATHRHCGGTLQRRPLQLRGVGKPTFLSSGGGVGDSRDLRAAGNDQYHARHTRRTLFRGFKTT